MPYTIEPVTWRSAGAAEALGIRLAVFVDEQAIPACDEVDAHDAQAYHVVARNPCGQACGTGRLFTDEHDPCCGHIGRMAVLRVARGTGCGAEIMRALIGEARQRRYRRLVLSAQVHAIGFYEKFGFCVCSAEYDDSGIPHRTMQRVLLPEPSPLRGL